MKAGVPTASGQPRPDLTGNIPAAERMNFFELLRRLEDGGLRFGRSGGPEREPVRLGQRARMSFATGDIAGLLPGSATEPPFVAVEVIGLLGPEGALPLHMTRWVMERLSDRWFAGGDKDASADTTFLDFCNMVQHRMIALYWRAWADARPEVQLEHGPGDRTQAVLDTLAAVGLPGMKSGNRGELRLRQRHATSLGQEVHGVERLTRYVSDVVQAPVRLVEFVGAWIDLPERVQTRLGRAHAGLGTTAVIGARSFGRQGTAELQIGPLSLARFTELLEVGSVMDRLRRAIGHAVGRELEFNLRLILAGEEVPEPRLGQCRLGRTTWLAARQRLDADDLCIARINGNGRAAA